MSETVKPKRLTPGDRLAIVAPSGPVHRHNLDRGLEFFKAAGFEVTLGEHVFDAWGYLAGRDGSRADDLNRAFRDPGIKAVICARGGYGASRILDSLDYRAIAAHPKVFMGFSDITGFHTAIRQRTGLVTFHGPGAEMPATAPPPDWTVEHIWKALTGDRPIGEIHNPHDGPQMVTITGGSATAKVVGGNLSLIAATMGTQYEIDTRGCLLLIEDVGERPYRIDRMLAQLRMGGKFDSIVGVVIGECVGCEPDPDRPSISLLDLFDYYFGCLGIPVMYGLGCGHGEFRATIPLGTLATIDADRGMLIIEERATV